MCLMPTYVCVQYTAIPQLIAMCIPLHSNMTYLSSNFHASKRHGYIIDIWLLIKRHTYTHIHTRLELCLQQNEIMDFFPDDYLALSDTDGITGNKSDTNMKEYQSFTDLKFSKDKIVTAIDWHPTIKGE